MPNVKLSAVNAAIDASPLDDNTKTTLKAQVRDVATPIPDTWVYRIVVIALGLAIFVPLVALFGPSGSAQLLLPISTAALGVLAGLLAPSPAARNS